jgi:hypothetical protein
MKTPPLVISYRAVTAAIIVLLILMVALGPFGIGPRANLLDGHDFVVNV